jgi:hypothetical protein
MRRSAAWPGVLKKMNLSSSNTEHGRLDPYLVKCHRFRPRIEAFSSQSETR